MALWNILVTLGTVAFIATFVGVVLWVRRTPHRSTRASTARDATGSC